MVPKTLLAVVALVVALPPTTAQGADSRLVSIAYNPDEVVRIEGKSGVQATVAFGENEHIENVAVGDAEKWQITPNKRADLLFVKPLSATARTNMTVVTDQHTYFFDLVATPSARPIYMLRFTYADAKPKVAPGIPGEDLNPAERQVLGGDSPVDPAMLNFAWRRDGLEKLLPVRVYDDGASTYLLWGADQPVPAILIRNDRGEEGPVNFAVRGNTIVIDSVPKLIVLRTGKAQASLVNMRETLPPAAAASTAAVAPAVAGGETPAAVAPAATADDSSAAVAATLPEQPR